jgi:hypothetical protein
LLYFFNQLRDEVTEKGVKINCEIKGKIDEMWKEYAKKYPSEIDRLFTSMEKTMIKCNGCKKSNYSLQYHICFPL